MPFLPSCLKMVTFTEHAPESLRPQLLPAAYSPALLLGGAPWQQAQPRAQHLVCVTWGAGRLQPEEEREEYYLFCSLFGMWLHVPFLGFCSTSVGDLKLHLENVYPKMFSVPEGSRESLFCWLLAAKQRVAFWGGTQSASRRGTCGSAMVWGCTTTWLYHCFM